MYKPFFQKKELTFLSALLINAFIIKSKKKTLSIALCLVNYDATHAVLYFGRILFFSFVLFIFSFSVSIPVLLHILDPSVPPSFYLSLSLSASPPRPSLLSLPTFCWTFFDSQLFVLLFFFFLIPLCDPNLSSLVYIASCCVLCCVESNWH